MTKCNFNYDLKLNKINGEITSSNTLRVCSLCIALLFITSDAYASAFNVETAGRTVFDPIVKLVTDHYGKGVVAVGGAGALIAPGDLRTKAIGFGIGAGIAGLIMLGVKAGFGI